jgi:hypothetical protein
LVQNFHSTPTAYRQWLLTTYISERSQNAYFDIQGVVANLDPPAILTLQAHMILEGTRFMRTRRELSEVLFNHAIETFQLENRPDLAYETRMLGLAFIANAQAVFDDLFFIPKAQALNSQQILSFLFYLTELRSLKETFSPQSLRFASMNPSARKQMAHSLDLNRAILTYLKSPSWIDTWTPAERGLLQHLLRNMRISDQPQTLVSPAIIDALEDAVEPCERRSVAAP